MPQTAQPFDHFVHAVADLDAAADAYQRLGFTLAPRGVHPWGTWNRVLQLADRTFIEILSVGEPDKIVEAGPGQFSFGAFNRDALATAGEGMTMLVFNSTDTAETRAAWARAGLPVYAPFGFGRVARAPDGTEREVRFSLTFTGAEGLPDAAFFACEHHFPENFWKPALQAHANGATGVDSVTLVAPDPARHAEVLAKIAGSAPIPVPGGVAFACGTGRIDLCTPAAFEARFGARAGLEPGEARFRAITLTVGDLAACEAVVAASGLRHHRTERLLVVPQVNGLLLAFTESP